MSTIPQFPEFKKLELSDREEILAITSQFPPYSDFDFGSLWAWDSHGNTRISILNSNLVVQFSDYITNELFYSFIGNTKLTDTAIAIFDHAKQNGMPLVINLMPEQVAVQLESFRFEIEEDRNQFDYIYTLANHIPYLGSSMKDVRYLREAFYKRTPGHIPSTLDLRDKKVKEEILTLLTKWEMHRGDIQNEPAALRRCLETANEEKDLVGTGIRYKGELIAFAINSILPNSFANCLFAKADVSFYGIYSVLMYENARILIDKNCTHLNFEQDLGLDNLRMAKMAYCPSYFLKKYTVTRKVW